jgi:autotransporter-associated beta strand protein
MFMKTEQIKISKQSARKALGAHATSIGALFMVAAFAPATHTVAGTWDAQFSNNWNDYSNWSDFTVPNGAGATATFSNLSNQLSPTLSAPVQIESITFDPGANAYTIETNSNMLTIQGAGIVNNSGTTQTIINNATAINAVAGVTVFSGTATAGSATITNDGGTAFATSGGFTNFSAGSTAGSATITNDAGTAISPGATAFHDSSTAGSATITNNGGTASATSGGATTFYVNSNAGSATIANKGGTASGTSGGATTFYDNSNAGSVTITNYGGTANGTPNNGTANGPPSTTSGGFTNFRFASNAGSATIINYGGTAQLSGGATGFFDASKAGSATIITYGGTGGGSGGSTFFFDRSDGGTARAITDGNGTFDISGLTADGMGIGSIEGNGKYLLGSKILTVGGNNLSTTVSGVIQDGGIDGGTGGSLTKIGTGTLTLTGTNTYSGGTNLNGGILALNSDVNLGTGPLNFNGGTLQALAAGGGITSSKSITLDAGGGTFLADANTSSTLNGVISGTGNLIKLGTGTLTLTNTNTYTGSTTVNSGSLIVDRSTKSAETLVNPGAFLGGHGTIGGNLVNSGIVGQINSPGTLTVGGNYTQNANGTLRIGVGGIAPAQNDLLAVNGHATLGGTLQLISLGGFTLQPGEQITFLTAKNGVSGTFSNTQNGLISTGTIVEIQVTSLANSVVLETTTGSFQNILGLTSNESAVAKALDSARGDPREAALFAFLDSQPLANLPHDLTLIAPTQITSINATAVSVGKVQVSNVGQRLANIRGGSNGFSSAGFSINGGAASIGDGFAGVSGPEGKSGPAVFAPTPDNRWGVFVTGIGEFSNVDSTPDAAGYDVNTGGVTFGVDYRLTPNFALGLTGGYAHTSVGLDGGGNIDVNGGKLGLYATLFGNGFYLDTAVTGGPSGYTTHRTALQGTASGSTDGADFNALVAVGYDWTKGNLSIGPTASFQYSYTGLNSFTETGSLAPLKFPDQNTESERSAFGAKASYQWKVNHVTIIPQVTAAWQHEYGDSAYSIVSSFATGAGKSFTVTGPDIGRDSLLVGAGATVIWNERVSTYLYYDGEFARTNYLSNNVSGGVRISF